MQKDLLTKQNKSLTEEIKKFKLVEEEFQIYRDKFNSLLKEKSNKDNLSLKQEEKLSKKGLKTVYLAFSNLFCITSNLT